MNSWIAGGAMIGILGACWEHIKVVFSKVYSLFIVTVKLDGNEIQRAVALYCWNNLWRSPYGERCYGSYHLYARRYERYVNVVNEKIGNDPIIFWSKWRPLLLGSINAEQEDTENTGCLTFIRGTWNADDLLFEAMELYNKKVSNLIEPSEKTSKRFMIYKMNGEDSSFSITESGGNNRNSRRFNDDDYKLGDTRIIGYKHEELGPKLFQQGDPKERLSFPNHVWKLLDEMDYWQHNQEWYVKRDIPWKRGALIYGTPGNGKSSLIRAMAEYLDLPIYSYRLGTFTNEEFEDAWEFMIARTPCIALFEDIDAVFDGRKNIQSTDLSQKLTFDCFLNVLDGVVSSDGVFTIITTIILNALILHWANHREMEVEHLQDRGGLTQ